MIAHIGEASLWLAVLCAALQTLGLFGRAPNYVSSATVLVAALLTLSFTALLNRFALSDFSLQLVAQHSHTAKPLLYKLSGAWGNHEGSILLFCWLLSLVTLAFLVVALRHRSPFLLRALGAQGLVLFCFTLYTALVSSPFVPLFPAPEEGQGLNPLLQDIGLALHPPQLYIGYALFSLGFAMAVAGLLKRAPAKVWAAELRPWIIAGWVWLTVGIALGSWWAYRELGWGGFWFWDPVENASLLPWLAATALLHALRVVEVQGAQVRWSYLLAILTFALGLVGFFLVRSGVLSSVHSFALDPGRGLGILILLTVLVGGALFVYALKSHRLTDKAAYALYSREGLLLVNNLLLMCLCFTVLLGTLYPLFTQAFGLRPLSVGVPYFNATFNPIAVLTVIACAIGGPLAWRRDKWRSAVLLPPLLSLVVLLLKPDSTLSALALWGAAWLAFSLVLKRPASSAGWPMWVAHLGLALLLFSVALHFAKDQQREAWLKEKDTLSFAGWEVQFKGVQAVEGPNYIARRGHFTAQAEGSTRVHDLYPETRYFMAEQDKTNEVALAHSFTGELYLVIGDRNPDTGAYAVRLYWRPMMWGLWLGAALMAAGGALGLWQRRKQWLRYAA